MSTDGTNAFPAARNCPQCGYAVQSNEKFCSQCGTSVRRALGDNAGTKSGPPPVTGSGDQVFTPLPSTPTMVRKKRKRPRKPSWYKRPRYIVPLVLLAILVTAGGVFAYRTRSAFQEVQSISTPPPEVSGSALGLEEDVAIDTGPAQEAIRQREQRETGQGTSPTEPAQTAPPATDAADVPGGSTNGTDEADSTSTAEGTNQSNQLAANTSTNPPATEPPDIDSNTTEAADPNGSNARGINPTAPNGTTESTSQPTETRADETEALETGATVEPTIDSTSAVTEDATKSATDESVATEGPSQSATSESTEEPEDQTPESVSSAQAPELQSTDGITVLLMGVDARDGESIDIGVRPDSLAVLHIDQSTGDCRMLAVPRDSRAELPGYGQSKINHALAVGGIPYEMLVVEEYLGIELDNYVLVDFAGVETVVDELGGITVDNPAEFEMEGQTFEAGTLHLDGERALLYSRFRGDSEGDFGRISRQQQVLRGLMHEVADVNLVKLVPNMFSLLSDHFRTDYGVTDLVDLANSYRKSCSADSIETDTIEGDVSMERDDLMQMDLSFVVSDPEVVDRSVAWLLMQDGPDADQEGTPAADPDEQGTPAADIRKDDDLLASTVAGSILLSASAGPS